MTLPDWLADDEAVAHVHHRPARAAEFADLPAWVGPALRDALATRGITRLWRHQADAAEAAFAGRHVAIATGTASGKTLAYLLPVISAGVDGRLGCPLPQRPGRPTLDLPNRHTALYLAPTKALAHDQLRVCRELGIDEWRVGALDGDSDAEERRWAREFGSFVLSNPDMLHRSLLPQHARWSRFLSGLRYVVVDEAHRYRGVFGAHVACVLRRLRRVCRAVGSDPVFVFASATVSDADEVGRLLAGVPDVTLVDSDASPAPALDLVLRRPLPGLNGEAGRLLARLTDAGQALAFTTSRVQAELVSLRAKELSSHPEAIASYRGGYLPSDRRLLERRLQTGELRGVASTNALELGVDIAGVDAVVTVGYPGTLAALWQQIGRAGRTGRDALAVLLAREDPLDAYLVEHPELITDAPIERTVVHVDNPHVLAPHLAAAAQERPLTAADEAFFGPTTVNLAERLADSGVLRKRASGWFWPHASRAVDSIDLRSINGKAWEVVDEVTGRVIGQVDPSGADRTLHDDAIYVHQGEQWQVVERDESERVALVRTAPVMWFTQPQALAGARILEVRATREFGRGTAHFGMIELSSQVVGYLRRDNRTGDVWDSTPLTMPERHLVTASFWWTLDDQVLDAEGLDPTTLPGAVHGAEHTAIGLLPAIVPCDRWDVGGLSTVAHPDTGRLTVFVHDGLPGGSGFAERGFHEADRWWRATLERLQSCPCESGCPACVVSPKCGNGNKPLDKHAAAALTRALLG